MKTEIHEKEIKCPKCDSEKWRFNAFHNLVPIEDQFAYTYAECQEQFNIPESREVSSNPNDAPRSL